MTLSSSLAELSAWISEAGLVGTGEGALVEGFCRHAREAGLPLDRAVVIIDTLHPVHEGIAVRCPARDGSGAVEVIEYGRTNEGEAAEQWRRSPFYHLRETGERMLRRRLYRGEPADFPAIEEARAQGMTDCVILVHRFAAEGIVGEMDCVYSTWGTAAPEGFSDRQVEALHLLLPPLLLAVKCAALARIAATLVTTYLGRDAGRRVLAGKIARGVADRIETVLWFSDLRGFTQITDTAAPAEIIPLLNDYAGAVIASLHDSGGDVLKLIGDGTLALFAAADPAAACRNALAATRLARRRIAALNARRHAEGLPTTHVYLGLHAGEVFYGNIGSEDRLDFTVVGPAVNEVSRIAAMCRSADQELLLSPAFVAAADDRARFVSVGRYALRGVGRPQELFTLDPAHR
jgi:adenylate cyclase